MNQIQKHEEYRLFVEDTARFSDRRQMVSNVYVAVNSALVAGVVIVIGDAINGALWLLLIALLLLGAGIIVCVIWRCLIIRYKATIRFRCKLLMEMEKDLKDDSYQVITRIEKEKELEETSFSDIEAKLPWVFITVYSFLFMGILVGVCLRGHALLIQALCTLCGQLQ